MNTNHEHEFYWYPHQNEEGWKCAHCDFKPGEPPGFSPERDRLDTAGKVGAILMDMHNTNLIYVSNGSHGDHIEAVVAKRCQQRGLYDQYSIARFILDQLQPSHAKYWKKIGTGVFTGRDTRARCPCGALSTCSTLKNGENTYRCTRHYGFAADMIENAA